MLKRILAGLIVAAVIASAAVAAPVEFLFTPDKAIFLANRTEIVPGMKFDEPTLRALLPEYEFEAAAEEGQQVWYVYARKDAEGVGQGGINIYINPDNVIELISGGEGIVDSAGATTGLPLTQVYKSTRAKSGGDFAYTCESEISPNIVYVLDKDDCGSNVEFKDYFIDKRMTTLDPCMKVYSVLLLGSESDPLGQHWRFP